MVAAAAGYGDEDLGRMATRKPQTCLSQIRKFGPAEDKGGGGCY